jgi:hypothetical protein
VYALVYSINYANSYGAIRESGKSSNLFGPVTSTTGVTGGQSQPASRPGLPPQ